MMMSRQHIFRDKALQHYQQSQERDILPQIVTPRIFLSLWILLGLLLVSTILTWLEQVPTKIESTGVILDQSQAVNGSQEAVGVLFLPAESADRIHNGQSVQTQIETRTLANAVVVSVVPGIKSPNEIKQSYGQAIAEPSVVVLIAFKPPLLAQEYAGTFIHAQIQVGTRSMLSLLPGVSQWIGGA